MPKNTELHPYCKQCLRDHPEWHLKSGKVYYKDKASGEDLRICGLIHEEVEVGEQARELLGEDEIAFVNFLHNPALWSRAELSWIPRWYQDIMLKCSALRKVSRIGRRAGKCFAYGEEITINTGERIKVEDLIDCQVPILAYDQDTSNFIESLAWFSNNGVQDVFKVILDDGTEIKRTGNHPLLTAIGWTNISEISIGTKIAVPMRVSRSQGDDISKDLLKIVAYIIGDGNTTSDNLRFSSSSKDILDDLARSVELYNCELKHYSCDSVYDYHIITKKRKDHQLKRILKNLSIMEKNSHNKRIPQVIMRSNDNSIKFFLNRLFATDGWASKKSIGYCSVNRKLVDDIFELLLRFGIRSKRRTRKVKFNGKELVASELNITNRDSIIRFRNNINIFSKEDAVEKLYKEYSKHNYSTSLFDNYGKEVWKNFSIKEKRILRNKYGLRSEYGPNKRVLNKALDDLNISFFEFKNENIGWASVKYVEYIGKLPTVSVYVEKYNTIVTDVIEHNTEAIAVNMLHYAYTHENVTVLVIAPYKNQVGLIFDRIDTFLGKSDSLRASIKRSTKNPYRLELHNGSRILGFTAGTRTGSKSTGIRGQDAHLILIDEADYLSSSDFEVILAIQASRPDVLVWMSSTPTGKREMFWRFCTDKQLGYKEFHFPSSVSPFWTDQTERLAKAEYSEQGYQHEFDAEFGDIAEGVFLKKFVDPSVKDYELNKVRRNHESLYTMGVDWNTAGNGTCIIVTEWNKSLNDGRGAFKVVVKKSITIEEFTQVRSCEEIIRLNSLWNPEYIYVDTGYGATQVEMLRKYGLEHLLTGLANKVKGIYFGDRMEIRDPVTKQIIKKHMKPFMVNLAARRMEDGQIILPESEDIKNGLVGQIRDYTVIRTSALGQPVYSEEHDHAITAWMLSILGATMEFSDMVRQNRAVSVGIAGRFGETQSPDFKLNKTKLEEERAHRQIVTPRWFDRMVFQETTARNTLDFLRQKTRKPEGKKSLFSVTNLKRTRGINRREGRASF